MKLLVVAAQLICCTAVVGASPADTVQRIQRVQRGIVPPVLVSGETPAMRSLGERMAEDKVPGVSIAVIHEGRIEWARGFGVTHTGGPAPQFANLARQESPRLQPFLAELGVLESVQLLSRLPLRERQARSQSAIE